MEPAGFARLAREVYGQFGAQSALARKHEVHRSTVQRWFAGELPIPQEVKEHLAQDAQRKAAALVASALGVCAIGR
jgi:hypothetical protein